jgi:hypothetical protein
MSELDTTAVAPATTSKATAKASEIGAFWQKFEIDFESAYEILRSVNHVADAGTDFFRIHEVAHDWVDALASEIATRDMEEENVAQLQTDLPKLSALLAGCMALEEGDAFKKKVGEARAKLDSFRPRIDMALAKGFFVPAPPPEAKAKKPKPPEFMNGRTEDDVQKALTEIVTVCESACRYVGTSAQAGKVDLAVVRSMIKQVGSLADDLGMTAYVVGSPADWVVDLSLGKAGSA